MPGSARDTDQDWVKIGSDDPYWGVLSAPKFAQGNIDHAGINEFYDSGRLEIDVLIGKTTELFGQWKTPQSALDFGCGVGRLSAAMTKWAASVTGYDISPGMLDVARRRFGSTGNLYFTQQFPSGPFDWINNFIVFQHISPDRGLRILDQLLERLSNVGVLTLHFTLYRDETLEPPKPRSQGLLRRMLRHIHVSAPTPPVGSILMFDYDLGAITRRLNACGIDDIRLIHTNHGGHHGAYIIGRRGG